MSKPMVTLYVDSNGTHLHQIFTGLDLMRRDGAIDLKLRSSAKFTRGRPNRQFIALKLETGPNSKLAIFDLQDSPHLGLKDSLSQCDFYFKRSLVDESYIGLERRDIEKLKPFGFNYQVIAPCKKMAVQRVFLEYLSRPFNPFRKKNNFHLHNLKELFDANFTSRVSPLMTIKELEPKGYGDFQYDVLFQCRLWDPNDLASRNRADAERVNAERMALVSQLKKGLGDKFIGGLQPTGYAKKVAPDLTIKSTAMAHRRSYIDLVKASSIVISSSGLLGSNGWKLGEYISLGKAIVSEPITSEVPGKFQPGVHYESYTSAEECMNHVNELLSNPEKIRFMSQSVAQYYASFLEPKALMTHHLEEMAR